MCVRRQLRCYLKRLKSQLWYIRMILWILIKIGWSRRQETRIFRIWTRQLKNSEKLQEFY